ncbi:glutaconate CoA-transferase subunit A [Clostridia bacterium]|nr:glutaconate CoA-transferase subunit A [Clostridia bacterium]
MTDYKRLSNKLTTLSDAIGTFVSDGSSLCFSGMAGGQCVAHTYEIIRQKKTDLVLIGDSPCEAGDLLAGAGSLRRMEIAYCSYAVAGLGYNFRRAVESCIPREIELVDYSNYTIGLRFLAGAIGVPYIPSRSLLGSDIPVYNKDVKIERDPFGGELVSLIPAARPDTAIVHVSRADKRGNGQMFGFSANAENMARAANHTILTCEELVTTEEIRENGNLTIIPEYCVDAVVELPYACHPWNMPFAYAYDIPFHSDQLAQFATRENFLKWLDEWCFSAESHEGYLRKVGYERLDQLTRIERKFCKLKV